MDENQSVDETSGRRMVRLPNSTGIECPRCGCVDSEVLRTTRLPSIVLRQRRCLNDGCLHRWQTSERSLAVPE